MTHSTHIRKVLGLPQRKLDSNFTQKFLDELEKFNKRTSALDDVADITELTEEKTQLQKQVTDLEIQQDRKDEQFARKEREIEHKIGLERKRAEFEREEAEKNARLTVREENLSAEQTRMHEQNEYIKERMEHELDAMRSMTEKVMQFIPTVKVDRRIREETKQIESGDDE